MSELEFILSICAVVAKELFHTYLGYRAKMIADFAAQNKKLDDLESELKKARSEISSLTAGFSAFQSENTKRAYR
jgi:peptidoglycan hydrolase CwlO-like protein